jgi:AcrR family transcriptional regulator
MVDAKSQKPDHDVFDRTRQFDRKRAALIQASAHAFHENGYAGTTLDMIAASLGVTKKALYRYISGKGEILYEIFCLWLDLQSAALDEAETLSGSAADKLRTYAGAYITGMFENLVPTDRLVGEVHILPDDQRAEIQGRRRENDERLAKIFEQGRGSGLQGHDPKFAVHTLNGAVDWIFKWYNTGGKLTPAGASDAVMDILMAGMET